MFMENIGELLKTMRMADLAEKRSDSPEGLASAVVQAEELVVQKQTSTVKKKKKKKRLDLDRPRCNKILRPDDRYFLIYIVVVNAFLALVLWMMLNS